MIEIFTIITLMILIFIIFAPGPQRKKNMKKNMDGIKAKKAEFKSKMESYKKDLEYSESRIHKIDSNDSRSSSSRSSSSSSTRKSNSSSGGSSGGIGGGGFGGGLGGM